MQETQEMWVWSLGQEDPLEEEMASYSSIFARKISWTEGPGLDHKELGMTERAHPHTCQWAKDVYWLVSDFGIKILHPNPFWFTAILSVNKQDNDFCHIRNTGSMNELVTRKGLV